MSLTSHLLDFVQNLYQVVHKLWPGLKIVLNFKVDISHLQGHLWHQWECQLEMLCFWFKSLYCCEFQMFTAAQRRSDYTFRGKAFEITKERNPKGTLKSCHCHLLLAAWKHTFLFLVLSAHLKEHVVAQCDQHKVICTHVQVIWPNQGQMFYMGVSVSLVAADIIRWMVVADCYGFIYLFYL